MHTLMMNKQFTSEYVLRDDIQSADLIYGDPYEWKDGKWISASTPMKKRVLLHYLIIGPLQSNQNLSAYVMGLN